MSLALNSVRPLFSTPWMQSFTFMAATALGGLISRPFALSLPTLQSIHDILSPFLLAVPKKKTSHSRKAMRSANKGLTDKTNIVNCPACGRAKLAHHLCPNCYSQISRGYKREARLREGRPGPFDGVVDLET